MKGRKQNHKVRYHLMLPWNTLTLEHYAEGSAKARILHEILLGKKKIKIVIHLKKKQTTFPNWDKKSFSKSIYQVLYRVYPLGIYNLRLFIKRKIWTSRSFVKNNQAR